MAAREPLKLQDRVRSSGSLPDGDVVALLLRTKKVLEVSRRLRRKCACIPRWDDKTACPSFEQRDDIHDHYTWCARCAHIRECHGLHRVDTQDQRNAEEISQDKGSPY